MLEIRGGLVPLIGLATIIAPVLFINEMIVVSLLVKSERISRLFELELLILTISFSHLLSGLGRISIERDIPKRKIFPVKCT
jgi:putative oxidoreductase